MKAHNEIPAEEVKDETPVIIPAGESPLKLDEIKLQFKEKIGEIKEFTDITVDSDESLVIAENNSSSVNEIIKNIDKVRVAIKEPYFSTVKMIDEYAKTMVKPLEEIKKTINESIANYKRVQAAAAKIAAEKAQKEINRIVDEKAEEADRLNRIERQLIARIYGGSWTNKEGQLKTAAGCFTENDCDLLLDMMKTKVPKSDTYTHLVEEYKLMMKSMAKKLSEHKTSIIESGSDSKTIREAAAKQMEASKEAAVTETNDKKDELTATILKEAKSELKTFTTATKEAKKGMRRLLKFELEDKDKVPTDWLVLDDSKVREWLEGHSDRIKELAENGPVFENGIKFSFEDTYVSR